MPIRFIFPVSLLLLGLTGCATGSRENSLEKSMKNEKPLTSPGEIADEAHDKLSRIPGLTAEQKVRLYAVQSRVMAEGRRLRLELGQAKGMLFKLLANPQTKEDQIDWVKNKIVALDQERLKVMFKALDEVREIIGKVEHPEDIYEKIFDDELERFRGVGQRD